MNEKAKALRAAASYTPSEDASAVDVSLNFFFPFSEFSNFISVFGMMSCTIWLRHAAGLVII